MTETPGVLAAVAGIALGVSAALIVRWALLRWRDQPVPEGAPERTPPGSDWLVRTGIMVLFVAGAAALVQPIGVHFPPASPAAFALQLAVVTFGGVAVALGVRDAVAGG